MRDISEIDKNLKVETTIQKDGLKFYDIKEQPFKVYGVFHDGERYRRMPDDVAKSVSDAIHYGVKYTAGGRVRFRTNSSFVAIHYKGEMGKMPHFAFTGSCGFDLYFGNTYVGSFVPPMGNNKGYESLIDLGDSEMKEVTINFPTYSFVEELYIGLDENAHIEAPTPYKVEKPVVFYGSSITQGGCSSRPGSCYEPYITRRFDCDHINLGFSGSARAEDEMAEYIAGLDMSLFVYDYDHNSPSIEHLTATHERMFKIIREKNPDLPIIMMSRPKYYLDSTEEKRLEIIKKTYENAKAAGDKNVYFIDGRDLCKLCGNEGTVDNCHPTDFGFASMAQTLGDFIEENGLL
ncbi:MAG: SGNH/GDSL hydrolase family protein [Clostridia bacterium]|nr:SGNH/GDSL hydrolase family protein [Clostridia bacterium]